MNDKSFAAIRRFVGQGVLSSGAIFGTIFVAFLGAPRIAWAGDDVAAQPAPPPVATPLFTAEGSLPANPGPLSEQANAPRDAVPNSAKDCAFGIAIWCFTQSDKNVTAAPSKLRIEAYGGYKFSNMYYRDEIRGCDTAGCSLRFSGPSFGADVHYNLSGNARSDDYFGLGISTSYMPVVTSIPNNAGGFDGELGRIAPGDGLLGYIPVRISIRRPNFLYLIRSKYLVSSFGAGLAFPISSGAGDSFTGANSVKITIGGRLGVELPVSDTIRVGIATNWSVIWYGTTFGESAFASAYGANLTYLL